MARPHRSEPAASPESAEPWLTVSEVARLLRRHPQTVRKYIRDGLLRSSHGPAISPNGHRHQIRPSDLAKFRARFMTPERIEAPAIERPATAAADPGDSEDSTLLDCLAAP